MKKTRTFTSQFKREVVEELLSGTTGPAMQDIQFLLRSFISLKEAVCKRQVQ